MEDLYWMFRNYLEAFLPLCSSSHFPKINENKEGNPCSKQKERKRFQITLHWNPDHATNQSSHFTSMSQCTMNTVKDYHSYKAQMARNLKKPPFKNTELPGGR